jgi:AcrR family transcriptional regulator
MRSAETRAALIEATIDCLCSLGYSGTSTTEISRRAIISTGALQHHFGSKDGLILASLDVLMAEMRDKLERFEQAEGTRADKCRSFVDVLWHQFYGERRYLAVWEIVVGTRPEKDIHKRVLKHRVDSVKACEEIWCKVFGIKDPKNDPSIEAMHFALSFMRGASFIKSAEQRPNEIERQLSLLEDVLVRSFSG